MSWLLDSDVLSQPAAIARRHNLTVATGNVKDFQRPGVKVFNPFSESES
jgi:hypothetical protein